jgi:phosphate-selective porin OprO and OprP
MTRKLWTAALLSASALAGAVPAHAQSGDVAVEIQALRAQVQALEARLAEMEGRAIAPAAAAAPAAVPPPAAADQSAIRFSGAPRITAPGGWSFKPRGRVQLDAGFVSTPDGVVDPGLGFANRLRRARIGAEGTVPGGFGYRLELDIAGGSVEVTDAYLTYAAGKDVNLILGQHNNFQSLDRMTSSNFTSFMERAAFTSAFNFERRLGLSATHSAGPVILQGGIFTDDVAALADAARGSGLGDENRSIGVSGRAVFAPKLGETQLHLGGSAHYRDTSHLADANIATRYRARPFLRTSNTRFIGTPPLRVGAETHYGLEAALIRGPFHAAGEAHWLDADTPGGGHGLFGGYVEVGYYLTAETRGYRAGAFDRTRVLKPVGADGGMGAVQVNLRYDHLDLNGRGVVGGRQQSYLASLIWIPQDYVRFMINYGHLRYDDATLIGAGGRRDYSADVIGARAQIDF